MGLYVPLLEFNQSEKSSAGPDLGPISEEMQRVRAAASALIEKADSASSITDPATAIEKAAGALKLAAELAKTRTELAKVHEEISKLKRENETASKRELSDRIRDYVTVLTPLITILTLAGTLLQFLASERDKRQEALAARWQDAVKTISESSKLSAGVTALQQFLGIPEYHEQATNLAINLLASSSDPALFTNLFSTALVPVSLPRAAWKSL